MSIEPATSTVIVISVHLVYPQLGKWQQAIQDYQFLMMETPVDEDTRRALAVANVRLRKQIGGNVRFKGYGSGLVVVNEMGVLG